MTLIEQLAKLLAPTLEDASDKILNFVEGSFNDHGYVVLPRKDVEILVGFVYDRMQYADYVASHVREAADAIAVELEVVDRRKAKRDEANQD